jgi:hypothetical protein
MIEISMMARNEQAEHDGGKAIGFETRLSGVALLDADVATRRGARRLK